VKGRSSPQGDQKGRKEKTLSLKKRSGFYGRGPSVGLIQYWVATSSRESKNSFRGSEGLKDCMERIRARDSTGEGEEGIWTSASESGQFDLTVRKRGGTKPSIFMGAEIRMPVDSSTDYGEEKGPGNEEGGPHSGTRKGDLGGPS